MKIPQNRGSIVWCPRVESNHDYEIRNLASYPLNDKGGQILVLSARIELASPDPQSGVLSIERREPIYNNIIGKIIT